MNLVYPKKLKPFKEVMKACVLDYNNFVAKAWREIHRLKNAEQALNTVDVLDFAYNAAFTVYHLLEWRQNPTGLPEDELRIIFKKNGKELKSAKALCKDIKKFEMNLLHEIV